MRGEGPLVIVYGDYECAHCAKLDQELRALPIRRVFRHFPVVSKHPRAEVLGCAAEAAARQGRFWEFHDSLYDDPAHVDPPHLWERCEQLGVDLGRFEADRVSDAVRRRVQRDFRSGIRAGVARTPALFVDGRQVPAARLPATLFEGL